MCFDYQLGYCSPGRRFPLRLRPVRKMAFDLLLFRYVYVYDLISNSFKFVVQNKGAIGVVWFVAWMIVAAKSPSDHSFISEVEKEYVVSHTREAVANSGSIVNNVFF